MTGTSIRLPPDGRSTGQARRFVADVLSGAGITGETLDAAVLLTSELATNAVLHARSDLTVVVTVSAGGVRVEVADENPRLPSPVFVSVDALSGRGLQLVQAVASSWGIETHDSGKVVWFELPPEAVTSL